MRVYSFEFRKSSGNEVVEGIELADMLAVRREAARSAREAMAEGVAAGFDRSGWIVEVRDDTGEIVYSLHFSELIQPE